MYKTNIIRGILLFLALFMIIILSFFWLSYFQNNRIINIICLVVIWSLMVRVIDWQFPKPTDTSTPPPNRPAI